MTVYPTQQSTPFAPASRVLKARVGAAWAGTWLRYCLTAVCAASAGVHAALVQPHLAEAGPLLGSAFAAAAAALAFAAFVVRRPQNDSWALAAATVTLCVVAGSYLLSRTTGLPFLIAHPEHVEWLGTVTTAAELAGAACGAALIARKDRT